MPCGREKGGTDAENANPGRLRYGSGKINTQLMIYAIIGIANIPFPILLGAQFGMGPAGIRLAATIMISIEVIILAFDLLRIVNKHKQDYEIQHDSNDLKSEAISPSTKPDT